MQFTETFFVQCSKLHSRALYFRPLCLHDEDLQERLQIVTHLPAILVDLLLEIKNAPSRPEGAGWPVQFHHTHDKSAVNKDFFVD